MNFRLRYTRPFVKTHFEAIFLKDLFAVHWIFIYRINMELIQITTDSFGSHNIIHPHPGDPAGVDYTPTCVPAALSHRLTLLIHSHLDALSAASATG